MQKILIIMFLLLLITEGSLYAVPTAGLVAEYLFNGNTNDTMGNDNNVANYGATLATDRFGNPNQAYSFDGSDYMNSSNVSGLQMSDGFAISVWIKKTDTSQDRIVGMFQSAGNSQPQYGMLYSNDRIRIQIKDSTNNWINALDTCSNTAISIATWHHLVFTFNKPGYAFYLDGVLDGSGTWDNSVRSDVSPYLYIGTRGDLYSGELFGGTIDDIRIYNRGLSASEVMQLYAVPEFSSCLMFFLGMLLFFKESVRCYAMKTKE